MKTTLVVEKMFDNVGTRGPYKTVYSGGQRYAVFNKTAQMALANVSQGQQILVDVEEKPGKNGMMYNITSVASAGATQDQSQPAGGIAPAALVNTTRHSDDSYKLETMIPAWAKDLVVAGWKPKDAVDTMVDICRMVSRALTNLSATTELEKKIDLIAEQIKINRSQSSWQKFEKTALGETHTISALQTLLNNLLAIQAGTKKFVMEATGDLAIVDV